MGREVFSLNAHRANAAVEKDLGDVVKTLGRRSALVANLRESLLSVSRMLQFFLNNAATWMRGDLAVQFRSVMRDVKSLDDYTNQQTQEMTFLLESTLGLINIQQNQIIKIFTIASVHLRHELRAHARAEAALGVPDRYLWPRRFCAHPDLVVQAQETALSQGLAARQPLPKTDFGCTCV